MKASIEEFDQALIDKVCADLDDNHPIRLRLPHWGRVHIDRRLPFVCLYRRPAGHPDKGTKQLLLGQASYILIPEQQAESDGFKALLRAILANLAAKFGSALLFEIWADDTREQQAERIVFNIRADKHRVSASMLEELETALLAIPFKKRQARVTLDYCSRCHPAGMPTLLSQDELTVIDCLAVGLGIEAIYHHGDQLLPYMLRHLHHWLTQALKRGFYAFARRHTRHRPAHFHELGRRSMTQAVWDTDKQLADIKASFDMLLHVTPVNGSETWKVFEGGGFSRLPEFNYRPRTIVPDGLKRQLYAISIDRVEDPTLAHIFRSQRDEIDRQLTMINDRNRRNFLYGSLQVFGGVEPWLLALARRILAETSAEPEPGTFLSAEEFALCATERVDAYRSQWPQFTGRVQVRDDVPGILVSDGDLLIGSDSRFPRSSIQAILAHEVGTHMLTYVNGKAQPFRQFYSGMANYEPLQEGLAVLSEYLVGELRPGRMISLAARVIAVDALVQGADFIETFHLLHTDFGLPPFKAYNITMRVYRGGGFTKDAVYLRGLSRLLDYLGEGGDMDILYAGKLALEDIPFVEELKWRQVLSPGGLIPHYLQDKHNQARLSKVRGGITVLDLLEDRQR